ncbi:hypothetical protein KPH14_010616 [Odynerus spinipes]|uniref:Uncharacterized protein n=1 Tax=Odynerus spinipes TaxID=1348599 RepID=A0AAD9RUY4_9HYME|nr:hypothetical protein KPH14_010616 [Odynerus spinipes]
MTTQNDLSSKTFQRAEKHLQGKLKTGYLQKYDHHVVPGHNLNKSLYIDNWNLDKVKKLYQAFPYECDLPKPLLPPAKLPRTVLHEEDPVIEPISVKSYLKDDINRILDYCEKHKKDLGMVHKRGLKLTECKEKKTIILPKYIAEIAELIELDPDPYLKGNYNWYYTGGCLNNVKLGDQTILLYPYAGELVASPLMSMENALWKPILKKSAKFNLDGTLYELKCSTAGDITRILGRYKNHVILYKLSTHENKLKLFEIHKQTSTLPYISGDINIFNQDHYCTVDVDHTIRFDLPALTLCPKQHLEQCESLSVEIGSRYDSCRYIGTYHNLLLCDSRSPKQCVRQKWTHQFRSTPLLLPTINRNQEEILVLSSLSAGENSVILNMWTGENSHSYTLPITLPSIMETLNESQLQGLCLDPYLRNRLELCNAGSTLLTNHNGDVFFFTQTSIGDMFYQCITHEGILDEHSIVKEKSISALNAWEQALLTRNDPVAPLCISSKCNMKDVYESFTNKQLQLQTNEQVNDVNESWRQPIEILALYEDILAPELLAVWDIPDAASIQSPAAPYQKVLSWLETADTKASPPQEDIEYEPTPVNTQELMSTSQEPDITCLNDSSILQELLLPKVKRKSIKKKK